MSLYWHHIVSSITTLFFVFVLFFKFMMLFVRKHHHITIVAHNIHDYDLEQCIVANLVIQWDASSGSLTWHQHTLTIRGCHTTGAKK